MNPTASSTDTSRVVRSDYTKTPYAELAAEAKRRWRGEWGADGRYSQSGYLVFAEEDDTKMSAGGINHVRLAYENAVNAAGEASSIQVLKSEAEIEAVSNYPIASAKASGYLNRACGWADAAASIKYLRAKAKATNRITFVCGTVDRLLYSSPNPHLSSRRTVNGVILTSGEEIRASRTILAAGPYTARLTDMRAACEARGQISCYIKLTSDELSHFPVGGNPVVIDVSNMVFIVGPDRDGFLKITHCSIGYRNPVQVTVASDGQPNFPGLSTDTANGTLHGKNQEYGEKLIETSLPWEGDSKQWHRSVPAAAEAMCRELLRRLFPSSSPFAAIGSRPFTRTRVCWYCDTRSEDFIICYHPSYAEGSLFVATGGSGHAFKFLPVIGERIAQIFKQGPEDAAQNGSQLSSQQEAEISNLKSLWAFPQRRGPQDDGIVQCEYGGRHGQIDLSFEDSLKYDRQTNGSA